MRAIGSSPIESVWLSGKASADNVGENCQSNVEHTVTNTTVTGRFKIFIVLGSISESALTNI